jgi:flagellar basal-body rod modification protein FlgD
VAQAQGNAIQKTVGAGSPGEQESRAEARQGGHMAATAGIWNQHMANGQTLVSKNATLMTGSASASDDSGSTSSSSSDSSTISANDFLTLLVTEMQNQDPTASTDPNEYINQLVQVNSLEQLISINQNLSTALGSSSTTSSSDTATGSTAASQAVSSVSSPGVHATAQKASGAQAAASATMPAGSVPAQAGQVSGNLSVPETKAAAQRVAQSLNGQSHAHSL